MSNSAILYHNPSCSKSRLAYSIQNEHQENQDADRKFNLHVIEYLQTPPNAETIKSLLSMLFPEDKYPNPLKLMRTGEKEFNELELDQLNPDIQEEREKLILAMVSTPKLIERPIFIKDGRAVIARPPERVKELL